MPSDLLDRAGQGDMTESGSAPLVGLPCSLDLIQEIQGVVAECNLDAIFKLGELERGLKLAAGMRKLGTLIDSRMMGDIMLLQNSRLGFKTDKAESGYPEPIVKNCFIEALFNGARPVGNEFNIIAAGAYLTKEFFERRVAELPDISDVDYMAQVPELAGGRAFVGVIVNYQIAGVQHRYARLKRQLPDGTVIDERIPVRVNNGMIDDAILGKARRKCLAAIFDRHTRIKRTIPDGEPGEGIVETSFRPVNQTTAHGPAGAVSADDFMRPAGNGQAARNDAAKGEESGPLALLRAFAALRPTIGKRRIEDHLGCSIEKATTAQLDELRGIHALISSGARTWASFEEAHGDG